MRFEAECRAVGLLDSCDDSDEEIKSLQDQIREKRKQKLGITQHRDHPRNNAASLPSTSELYNSIFTC